MVISSEVRAAIDEAIERYPQPRGALLLALHLVQAEHGFISLELAGCVAEIFEIRSGDVMEVISFYNMLHDGEVVWRLAVALGLEGFEGAQDVHAVSRALAETVAGFAGVDLARVGQQGLPLAEAGV